NALKTGKTDKTAIDAGGFIAALIRIIPDILKHNKFDECDENKDRSLAHLLVLYGFIGLFIVTSIFFVTLYGLQIHGPYSQLNPVKWLGNIAGVALIIGSFLLIQKRRAQTDQISSYSDWFLLGFVFTVAVSGLLAEITRLAGWAGITYAVYFIHLVAVWVLIAFLPFSKLAHLVYRTVAMAYDKYIGRI
ncbi:MAG: heterodisulfide reductase, partial [Deltaproteobacteria bacterium]|nr:heterodisulfide reductase [Deltaproteobacteria bacterium]